MLLGHLLSEAQIDKPKFFIIGDEDNFTGERTFVSRYHNFPEPKQMKIIEGEIALSPETHTLSGRDHFWFKSEKQLFQPILEWVKATIKDHNENENEHGNQESKSNL